MPFDPRTIHHRALKSIKDTGIARMARNQCSCSLPVWFDRLQDFRLFSVSIDYYLLGSIAMIQYN